MSSPRPSEDTTLRDRLDRASALVIEADTRASGLALRLSALESAVRMYLRERDLGHDDTRVLMEALRK